MSQTFEELDFLAAALQAAASKVKRAAALLKAAGDLDVLERRLGAVLGRGAAAIASDERSGPCTAVVSPGEAPARARLGSVETGVGRNGACAVFDDVGVEVREGAKQAAGERLGPNGRKPTAQEAHQRAPRGKLDIKHVPF